MCFSRVLDRITAYLGKNGIPFCSVILLFIVHRMLELCTFQGVTRALFEYIVLCMSLRVVEPMRRLVKILRTSTIL